MSAPAEDAGPPEWLEAAQRAIPDASARLIPTASPALLAVMAAAVQFAYGDERRNELVVDIQAVLGVLAGMPGGESLPDAHLLADWLNEERRLVMVEERLGAALERPLPPVLSASVRGQVLPRTAALAGAGQAGIWHLLMALAELDETQWPPMAPEPIDSAGLERLRAYLAERGPDTPDAPADTGAAALSARAARLPESTPLLSDNPSADDLMGRRPLVQALAIRLMRLQAEEAASPDPAAVMVHLHGAWGSGKSSMVKLLAEEVGKTHPRWLVVDFNAWRNTRVKPPWWNMLADLKRAQARRLLADVMPLRWLWLQLRWAWVSPAVDSIGLLAGALVVAALVLAGGLSINPAELLKTTISGEWAESLKELPAQAALYAGLVTAGFGALRAMLLGGRRVAESFDALRIDSYRPFIDLFALLTGISRTPVLIVLDDLDRCDASTVTDLLEGIQTLFRSRPVVFLAVADRRWITASFTKRFGDFQEAGGDAARPVGDLFLDKMFQLSVGVPQVGEADKDSYLRHLLGVDQIVKAEPAPPLPADVVTLEAGQAAIARAKPEQKAAVITQVALRLSEERADVKTSHRLLEWSKLIEPNPRAMKRLVNAVGMAQTRAVLEQRTVDFDTIALWTMLELRWPRAAEAIANDPRVFEGLFSQEKPEFVSPILNEVWADPQFRDLIDKPALQPDALDALLGQSPTAAAPPMPSPA